MHFCTFIHALSVDWRPLHRTHGHVGQLVCAAVRVDAVEAWAINVHAAEDQRSANLALVPVGGKQAGEKGEKMRHVTQAAMCTSKRVTTEPSAYPTSTVDLLVEVLLESPACRHDARLKTKVISDRKSK